MFKAPAQSVHITGAKFFKQMIELLVNTAQETENSAEHALLGRGLFGAMPIVGLFLAAVGVLNSTGQAGVDFVEMSAEKKSHHRRDDCAREKIRSEHGEDHRHGEWLKKKSGGATQEKNRHENDADTESGDKRRHRNLRGAVEDGAHHRLLHREIAMDVLDLDRGIIHQNADGERESTQRHQVHGLAEGAENDDRA